MTSDRDQLAELLHAALSEQVDGYPGLYVGEPDLTDVILDGHADLRAVADAILAAGWRPCNGRHWIEAPEDGFDW